MTDGKFILFVIKGHADSEKAKRILVDRGIGFREVLVEEGKNGLSMWRDTGTFEIPTLVTDSEVMPGIESIQNVRNND